MRVRIGDRRGMPQEAIKLIACVCMLLDHASAALLHIKLLRVIGRIAFPIYCYTLVEGEAYTRDHKGYGLRLALGAIISELPFDLALYGGFTWKKQSVMLTLLLGYLAIRAMRHVKNEWMQMLAALPFVLAAYYGKTDYGANGVVLILMFCLTRGVKYERWIQLVFLAVWGYYTKSSAFVLWGMQLRTEWFAPLAMIPIGLYSGKRLTRSAAVQWAFYFFYPVHLLIIAIIQMNRI